MTYQVLARKWRPKDFASLVGQEHVVRALTHALDGARLHHAYLFTGTRGVGKTTLSRIFAKALNCETGITATPCGVCRACREIDEGRFVDYVEMDAASNRGVDEMAALLERAVYAPVDARFKVYMIDEVHMLTNHAFNAMLKTLEEPPPHIKFILATTDPQKIPVTVLSRCLQFNLKQMPAGHIVGHLERILAAEGIAFEPQALRLLARAADGSMRDALSLTDQAIAYSANEVTEDAVRGMLGALDQSYLIRLVDALVEADGALVLAIADEMALRSLSFSTALQDLASLFHRIAWAQFAPAAVLDEWPEANDVRRFAQALSPEQVQLFYQIAAIGRSELGLAPDEYAGFTMTLLRMLAFEPAREGGGAGGRAPSTTAAPVGARRAKVEAGSSAGLAVGEAPSAPALPTGRAVPADSQVAARSVAADTHVDEPATDTADKVSETPRPAPIVANDAPPRPAEKETHATSDPGRGLDAPPRTNAAPVDAASPARTGGASAALEVLRSAGLRVSTDRGRARGEAAKAAAAPAPKPAAPRVPVEVSVPRARRDDGGPSAPAAVSAARERREPPVSRDTPPTPPWDDAPPLDAAFDDYVPLSAEDTYFSAPDEGFAPPDDRTGGDARGTRESETAPAIDLTKLPAPVLLDTIGFAGDWPALAVDLGLTGVAYQLAFNSELTALEGEVLKLAVPVPQYAEAAQVAKLKAALAQRLGRPVELRVEVGPARRTAAVLEAAARAERQREAEREIGADPFVQSLVREFGATIVPGSIKPLSPDTGASAR
ncbi:DNA polymerase-3 subunit gamma/tau [Trinickia symbiotica]|uniref:DNA polymerase III subunit gamma/tau n=1 Tax=Trinickia symbiotica TaxID=863227 RepID=A0A2N7WQL0_9BURK|nr:DNA polymerase III subunit gamma/tau [Trinickia symbiotica]PMS31709.1 DNA polymerase III subunit gamma/tau [Trinickia symbiotica]PPK41824.1 DNA polymerase-3 subunit gamma/tau [Trinickia symbiotica]